jgi:protein-L-isoaspartate(D-aspartate) O-methyltransferase
MAIIGEGQRAMTTEDAAARRDAMVRSQIQRRGVGDARVLAAVRAVPRELFVPVHLAYAAYEDRALPIGSDQTISQPYMVAVMTAALRLTANARVLEVGTGSGYQAAILSHLAREVFTIERRPELAEEARLRLAALGCVNVHLIVGDGTEGHAAGAPYDGILVTAGAPDIPEPLTAQLADGGRLVIPIGSAVEQDLVTIQRRGGNLEHTSGEPCVFVPLVGRFGWDR